MLTGPLGDGLGDVVDFHAAPWRTSVKMPVMHAAVCSSPGTHRHERQQQASPQKQKKPTRGAR